MARRTSTAPAATTPRGAPLDEAVYRLLYERSSDAILLLDGRAHTFIDCNEAAVRFFGAEEKHEVLDAYPWQLSPERQPDGQLSSEKARDMIALALSRGTHRFEWTHQRLDGGEFAVEIALTSIRLGERPLIVSVWRDLAERKTMERALRTSESRFRLLFEKSADPMQLLDLETWRFIDCNAACVELMRHGVKSELIGLSPWDISPEVQPDGTRSEDKARSLQEELMVHGTARFEWTHLRRDGSTFPTEITLTIIEQHGAQPLLFVIWREISERKRAEAEIRELNASLERRVTERTAELSTAQETLRMSEERFRLSFAHTADPFILMDVSTHQFLEANDAAVRFYGAPDMARLLAVQPWEVSPEHQPDGRLSQEKAHEMIELAKTRGAHRFEWRHTRFDGTPFPTEVSLTLVNFSDKPRIVVVLRDLTERKRVEAELQSNLAKARELTDLKSSFVSMVSHEFRTPLAVILSSAELLKNHLARLPEATRQEQLTAICGSTKHMSRMIDEVLLLGKVEAGQMRYSPVPLLLDDFCARLVDEMHSATQRRCLIELRAKTKETAASGDEALLRHILGNLLSNAVKYSPVGETVCLEMEREDEYAVLTITDRGMGIPAADLPKIFQAFHRAGNVGQVAGTGLGLVIVKRCVELHGGSIDLQSEAGRGTRVIVRLPLFPALTPTPKRRAKSKSPG